MMVVLLVVMMMVMEQTSEKREKRQKKEEKEKVGGSNSFRESGERRKWKKMRHGGNASVLFTFIFTFSLRLLLRFINTTRGPQGKREEKCKRQKEAVSWGSLSEGCSVAASSLAAPNVQQVSVCLTVCLLLSRWLFWTADCCKYYGTMAHLWGCCRANH